MTRRKLPASSLPPFLREGQPPEGGDPSQEAFDIYLKRGLHTLFGSVANEPIPDSLLRLIEENRKK